MEWETDKDNLPYIKTKSSMENIKLRNSSTQEIDVVPSISATTTYKLLDIQIAINGNQREQYKKMKEKYKIHTSMFAQCHFHPSNIQTGYNQVFLSVIKYTLAASSLTEKQCLQLQTNVKSIVLNKLGYNTHTPIEITYTSKQFGGIELQDLYVEQGILHIMFLIQHLRAQLETASIILKTIKAFQIQSGLHDMALSNTTPVNYLNTPWIESLWLFMYQNQRTCTNSNRTPLNKRQSNHGRSHSHNK